MNNTIYISQLLETKKLEYLLEKYKVGLEVISFSIGSVLDDLEQAIPYYEEDFKNIKSYSPMIFHGPFLDLLPGSCDQKVVALARERFEKAYEAAKVFKVNKFVFHTGYMPRTYPKKYWLENIINFWKDFTKDKLEDNFFYIENVLEEDWRLLKELIEAINHPHFKACLDIGHVCAYANTQVEEWISALGHLIGHVHLHNNVGIEDTHSSLLKGSLDIEKVLQQLKQVSSGTSWTLEIGNEEELIESLEWLIHARRG